MDRRPSGANDNDDVTMHSRGSRPLAMDCRPSGAEENQGFHRESDGAMKTHHTLKGVLDASYLYGRARRLHGPGPVGQAPLDWGVPPQPPVRGTGHRGK